MDITFISVLLSQKVSPRFTIRESVNLTSLCNDLGNEILAMYFLVPKEELEDIGASASQLQKELEPLFDSAGDYAEEVKVLAQNSELIVIVNMCK
jgi:uncharacterized phage infection (PIP) family protein YhgE